MKLIGNTHFNDLIKNETVQSFQTTRNNTLEQIIELENLQNASLIRMNQTHSNHVHYISKTQTQFIEDTDAIYTDKKGVLLAVRTADCLPILVYHPKSVLAGIHAGRKGTESQITTNTLKTMKDHFKLNGGFTYFLGPAICKNCYEIDHEKKLHFDLISENKKQIFSEDPQAKIIESNFCTKCRQDLFFSFRGGDGTERIFTAAILR